MNSTQTQTTSATLIALAAGYLAGSGILGLSVADWTTAITAAGAIGAIAWPLVATRVQALKNTVGKSGAVVVTSAASANALPNNPNVVAMATPETLQSAK